MQTPKKPIRRGSVLYRTAVLGVALGLVGCGGQIQFAGKSALAVAGELPPPPPPEPPKPAPRVEVKENNIEIHEKIQFEHDKATIKEASFGLLDEIVKVIKENAHIKKIQIEGHASAEGDAKHNLKLSDDRAKSVKKYLVDHGVAEATLVAKGFGKNKPLVEEKDEAGREKNRRVEFNIVEQDVTKKKVEIDPTTGKERVLEETKHTVTKPMDEPAPADAKKDAKKDAKVDAKKDAAKADAKVDAKKDAAKADAKKDAAKVDAKKDAAKVDAKKDAAKVDAKKDAAKVDAKKDAAKAGAKVDAKVDVKKSVPAGEAK